MTREQAEEKARVWMLRTGVIQYTNRDELSVDHQSLVESFADKLLATEAAVLEEMCALESSLALTGFSEREEKLYREGWSAAFRAIRNLREQAVQRRQA